MNYNQKQINENLPFFKVLKQNFNEDTPLFPLHGNKSYSLPTLIQDSKNFVIEPTFYNELFSLRLPKKILKEQFRLPFDKTFINFIETEANTNLTLNNPAGFQNLRRIRLIGAFLTQRIVTPAGKSKIAVFLVFEKENKRVCGYFVLLNEDTLELSVENDIPATKMDLDSESFINFILNCVLFLNQRNVFKKEVETKQHYTAKDERGQYHKIPINYYLCDVKINQEVVDYVKKLSLNSKKRQYCFQFDVRGHWRHLQSEKYKLKHGQNVWVDAYVKGSGLYIPKTYLFEQANKSVGEVVKIV